MYVQKLQPPPLCMRHICAYISNNACPACPQYMRRLPAFGLILKLDEAASSTLSTAVTSDEDEAAAAAAGPRSLSFMLPQALRGERHCVVRSGGIAPQIPAP